MKEREYSKLIHTTRFEVEKYVLPKFQITINSPQYILADVENVTWNICVKYRYRIFTIKFQILRTTLLSYYINT